LPGEIQAAYDIWRSEFTKSGDCNLTDNLDELPEDAMINPDGSVTLFEFTYIVTGLCAKDQCSSTFEAAPCGGHIFPTQTTCCNYLMGTAELQNVCYTPSAPSNGSVTNAIPGVFFYYTSIVAPDANFTVFVEQTTSCSGFNLFRVQQGKDIKLYDNDCNKLMTVLPSEAPAGRAKMTVKNAVPGATYVLAVKYNVKSLIGSTYTGPAPECEYSFYARFGTSVDPIPGSDGSITAAPGCSDNTPLPGDCTLNKKATISVTDPGSGSLKVYPNPFNDKVNFEFKSREATHVVLEIYNLLGQKTTTLMDKNVEKGVLNQVEYEPADQVPGILIYRLTLDNAVQTGRLIYNREE
jgi:hypothetical protein